MTYIPIGPTTEPDLYDLLMRFKRETMYATNCAQVGTIESYNSTNNTASVSINIKRRLVNDEIVDYPVLADLPVFILSGGGASITLPISKGDTCLVIFNDRNIDSWWYTGVSTAPDNNRCHSISDGIALVGIRSLPDAILNLTPSCFCINGGTHKIAMKNGLGNLKTIIDLLMDALVNLMTVDSKPLLPASITALNKVKAAFGLLLDEGLS